MPLIIFSKALHNLLLPDMLKLFMLCILSYIFGWGLISWGLSEIVSGYVGASSEQSFLIHVMGDASGMIIAWFLFPLLYPLLISFFDDKMAEIIEREDYPQLPPAVPPFWPTILHDVIFSLKAVGLNILCLPLYFVPLIGIFIYYTLNGYLLGNQFFRMAAGRRACPPEAAIMQKQARMTILLTGIGISFCATIPVLNLAAPMLGVASMLHLFHALRGTNKQTILPPY